MTVTDIEIVTEDLVARRVVAGALDTNCRILFSAIEPRRDHRGSRRRPGTGHRCVPRPRTNCGGADPSTLGSCAGAARHRRPLPNRRPRPSRRSRRLAPRNRVPLTPRTLRRRHRNQQTPQLWLRARRAARPSDLGRHHPGRPPRRQHRRRIAANQGASHTGSHPGGISLELPGHVFTGDTLFPGDPGLTGWPLSDFDTIIASIRAQIFTLANTTAIHPGHGPSTTVGGEKPDLAGWIAQGW